MWGYGERPALVLVDLYRWAFGDRKQSLLEGLKEWSNSCGPAAWDALPHIQRVLGAARAAGIPVVHLTGLHPLDSGVAPWAESPWHVQHETAPDVAMAERMRRCFYIV